MDSIGDKAPYHLPEKNSLFLEGVDRQGTTCQPLVPLKLNGNLDRIAELAPTNTHLNNEAFVNQNFEAL